MPKVERICQQCGKVFEVWLFQIKNGYGKFCSPTCVGFYCYNQRGLPNGSGKNSPTWRGGKKETIKRVFKKQNIGRKTLSGAYGDRYLGNLLRKWFGYNIFFRDIPPYIIKLKRLQITLLREARNVRKNCDI